MRSVRQHVNPLGLNFQIPRARAYRRPAHLPAAAPLEVELGCADAHFSFCMGRELRDQPVVGLEIREKVVELNERRARVESLSNLYFGYVNLNVDLDRVFEPGTVDRFHLLFPDPWFKSRHQKRRVVDEALCEVMASQLRPGGELHFASDIFELALDAMEVLESMKVEAMGFSNMEGAWTFSRRNPSAFASRRELTTVERGQRVWRMRYRYSPPERASRADAKGPGAPSSRAGRE